MASTLSKIKNRNEQALLRFTCDLLTSIDKKAKFNKDIAIGNSLTLGDIINNIGVKSGGRYIEFSGVFLQHQPTGVVLMKTQYKDDTADKLITQSFSIKRLGIKEAFLSAVEKRAELCGFSGCLPKDKIYIPTARELLNFSIATKGPDWVGEHQLSVLYNENP